MATELYSKGDIERHIQFEDALEVTEKTYVETARGRVLNPSKLTMHLGDDGEWPNLNAFSIDMPAYVDWLGVAGMKWAVATWDADTDHPISSQILLFDLNAGAFTAVMEGMYITGVRTALQSVVGLKHLSPSTPDSIGVLGAGFQAGFQLRVIDRLLDIDVFRMYDLDRDRARALAGEMEALEADVVVTDEPRESVRSDALITVTNSKTPVLEEAWLDGAAFVIALGSYRELPDRTIRSMDHVVVDHREQCLQRGALADLADRGEFDESDIDATIGETLAGQYPLRVAGDDRLLFVPIGLGSLDISLAESLRTNGMRTERTEEFEFV